MLKTKSESALN